MDTGLRQDLCNYFTSYLASRQMPDISDLCMSFGVKLKWTPGERNFNAMSMTSADTDLGRQRSVLVDRFRAWAKKMDLDSYGNLVLKKSGKIILSKEEIPSHILRVHSRHGANGPRHLRTMETLKLFNDVYSIGRQNFGPSQEYICSIVARCPDPCCLAKQPQSEYLTTNKPVTGKSGESFRNTTAHQASPARMNRLSSGSLQKLSPNAPFLSLPQALMQEGGSQTGVHTKREIKPGQNTVNLVTPINDNILSSDGLPRHLTPKAPSKSLPQSLIPHRLADQKTWGKSQQEEKKVVATGTKCVPITKWEVSPHFKEQIETVAKQITSGGKKTVASNNKNSPIFESNVKGIDKYQQNQSRDSSQAAKSQEHDRSSRSSPVFGHKVVGSPNRHSSDNVFVKQSSDEEEIEVVEILSDDDDTDATVSELRRNYRVVPSIRKGKEKSQCKAPEPIQEGSQGDVKDEIGLAKQKSNEPKVDQNPVKVTKTWWPNNEEAEQEASIKLQPRISTKSACQKDKSLKTEVLAMRALRNKLRDRLNRIKHEREKVAAANSSCTEQECAPVPSFNQDDIRMVAELEIRRAQIKKKLLQAQVKMRESKNDNKSCDLQPNTSKEVTADQKQPHKRTAVSTSNYEPMPKKSKISQHSAMENVASTHMRNDEKQTVKTKYGFNDTRPKRLRNIAPKTAKTSALFYHLYGSQYKAVSSESQTNNILGSSAETSVVFSSKQLAEVMSRKPVSSSAAMSSTTSVSAYSAPHQSPRQEQASPSKTPNKPLLPQEMLSGMPTYLFSPFELDNILTKLEVANITLKPGNEHYASVFAMHTTTNSPPVKLTSSEKTKTNQELHSTGKEAAIDNTENAENVMINAGIPQTQPLQNNLTITTSRSSNKKGDAANVSPREPSIVGTSKRPKPKKGCNGQVGSDSSQDTDASESQSPKKMPRTKSGNSSLSVTSKCKTPEKSLDKIMPHTSPVLQLSDALMQHLIGINIEDDCKIIESDKEGERWTLYSSMLTQIAWFRNDLRRAQMGSTETIRQRIGTVQTLVAKMKTHISEA